MRARTIKPAFWVNENLAEASPLGRLLFIGLWCLADREGRLEDRPKRIGASLFPYEGAALDIDAELNKLASFKNADGSPAFISRYSVDGCKYLQIVNFQKHQRSFPNEPESIIPCEIEKKRSRSKNNDQDRSVLLFIDSCIDVPCITDQTQSTESSPPTPQPETIPPPPAKPTLFEEVVTTWNSMAVSVKPKLPTSEGGDSIRKLVKTRAESPNWRANWKEALDLVPKIPFARGENKRGWKANLIWFLRPETVDKILSGFYAVQTSDGYNQSDLPEEFR